MGISIFTLLFNLLPLIIFSVVIALGLVFISKICVKIFSVLGQAMKILIIIGLVLGILKFLVNIDLMKQ